MISQGGKGGGDLSQLFMNNQATQAGPFTPISMPTIAAPVAPQISMPVPTGPRPMAAPQQVAKNSGMQQNKANSDNFWDRALAKQLPASAQTGRKGR